MGAPPDPDRPRRVARAWRLHSVERLVLREIADKLAAEIPPAVSHETVRQYIREAREAAEWEEVRDRAGKRARMVEFLSELARRGVERLEAVDEDGQPVERYGDIVTPLMRVVQEINRVEGNYAPIRVAAEDGRRAPDPVLLEAMRHEAGRAAAADEDETRRALEE